MENYSLLCKVNMLIDGFILLIYCEESQKDQKLCTWACLHKMEELAEAQFHTINAQETVFQEEGLTMANINLPQGE